MAWNVIICSILSVAGIFLMLTFFLPFSRSMLGHWPGNALCGILTVLLIAPALRAMVIKKNHSEEFKALWTENRYFRLPLLFTIVVRLIIASMFVFYICNYLTRFSNALMMTIALLVIAVMIMSRGLKKRSISLERTFILNLRSRDIDAQVKGRKKPLFVGRLLDRDLHIGNLEIPEDSNWAGKSLRELQLRKLFGVHVSSILRGRQRINIPNGHTILFPGDRIEAIGDDEQLSKLDNAIKTDLVPEDTDIEKREMKLRQMIISGNSEFVGKTLKDSGIRDKYNCMVVGVENGQERLTAINPNWILEKGNVLWIVGEEENLKALIG